LAAPGRRVARIHVNRDQIALHAQEHLALVRAPLRPEPRRRQPAAIEVAALRRTPLVDGASAAARGAVGAPRPNRFVERVDAQELAAQRALATASPGHQWSRVAWVV